MRFSYVVPFVEAEKLKISEQVHKDIIEYCLDAYPRQACGIVASEDDVLLHHYPMTNAGSWPYGFQLNPAEQANALKNISSSEGLSLGAIYHVHVTSRAYPTAKDTLRHHYKNSLCLIVSLLDENAPEIRGYYVDGENINEVELEVIKDKLSIKQELSEFRKQIDDVDEKIIMAISERIRINKKIIDIKLKGGIEIHDPGRESILIDSRKIMAKNFNLDVYLIESVFRNILEYVVGSMGYQKSETMSSDCE